MTVIQWVLYVALAVGYGYGIYYIAFKKETSTFASIGFVMGIFLINGNVIPKPYGTALTVLIIVATFVQLIFRKGASLYSKILSLFMTALMLYLLFFN